MAFTGLISTTVTWSLLLQLVSGKISCSARSNCLDQTYLPFAIPILLALHKMMKQTKKSLEQVDRGAETNLSREPFTRVQETRLKIITRQFRLMFLHLLVTEVWAMYCEAHFLAFTLFAELEMMQVLYFR